MRAVSVRFVVLILKYLFQEFLMSSGIVLTLLIYR